MPLMLRMLCSDVELAAPKRVAFFVGRAPVDDKITNQGTTCPVLNGKAGSQRVIDSEYLTLLECY